MNKDAAKITERFWAKVNKTSGCWLWTGGKSSNGYGHFVVDGFNRSTHRFAWTIENGPIPEGMIVLHLCDTPGCVRISHLKLGTQADNMADRDAKGRQARGARHGKTRLTEAHVAEIRSRVARGEPQCRVAADFGISRPSISNIVAGRRWGFLL